MSFKTLGENLYEYNNALIAFNSSSEQLQLSAQEVIESEKALAEARKEAAETAEDVENAESVRNAVSANEAARSKYSTAEKAYYEAQNRMVSAQRAASDSLSELNNSIESVGSIARAVASGSMKQLWDALGSKTQNRIGMFLSGSKSYEDALKSMSDILANHGNSMDFLVERIKGMTSDILSSGKAIGGSDFGAKITGMFSEIFGDENSDVTKFGKDLGKVLSNVFDKAQKEGKDTVEVVEEVGNATVKAISKNGGSLWVIIVGLILDLLDVLKDFVDPPYLSTDVSTYKMYWKLSDYLDVLTVLAGHTFVYFTSNKSSIIELCEWMGKHPTIGNPFSDCKMVEFNATLNHTSTYTDIMLYKKTN